SRARCAAGRPRTLRPWARPAGNGGSAEAQETPGHGLVVPPPAVPQEAFFRCPPQTDGGALALCPLPVRSPVDLLRESTNLHVLRRRPGAVRLAEQRAGEQDRRVDPREVALLAAVARLHIDKVIEEAAVTGGSSRVAILRRPGEKSQRREDALLCLRAGDVAALDADRIGGEAEPDRGDAGV